MPNIADHRTDPRDELRCRRSYLHGVNSMVAALDGILSEDQRAKLQRWQAELLEWRCGLREDFEAPPAPDLN